MSTYHIEKIPAKKYTRGKVESIEKELVRTCECTLLIDGRQHCTIRAVPRDLEILGEGYSIILGYLPEQVYIFKAEEDELIINTLTGGKYEHYVPRRERGPKLDSETVINLAREAEYYKINSMIDVSILYDLDKRRVLGIIFERNIDSMTYKIVGLAYRSKSMLTNLAIATTMSIDSTFINNLQLLNLALLITTGTVTYDAVKTADKYGTYLVGDVNTREEEYIIYTGT
ncbi:MAG: hypothetical protein GXO26_06290 [Crenarchaeota archaeon]|nr:hypothetical protein [Thermoproteota archaeon]